MAPRRSDSDADAALEPALLDALYGAPPGAFAATRKALVARMKKEGRADAARALSQIRKPTLPVYAINLAAREAPHVLAGFLEAENALAAAQSKALRGGPSEPLREAMRVARERLEDAVRLSAKELARQGNAATPQTMDRVRSTLLGAARGAPEVRTRLGRGWLSEEHSPAEMGGGLGPLTLISGGAGGAGAAARTAPERPRALKVAPASSPRGRTRPPRKSARQDPRPEPPAPESLEERKARRAAHDAAVKRAKAQATRAKQEAQRLEALVKRLEAEAARARERARAAAEEASRSEAQLLALEEDAS